MSDVSAGQGDAGAPKLSHEHLLRVCEFLYRRTGMTYGEAKRYYIERRIAERMARNGSV